VLKPCQFTRYFPWIERNADRRGRASIFTRYSLLSLERKEPNQLNQDTAMLIAVNLRLKALINKVRSISFTSSYRLAIGNKPSLLVIPC